MKKLTFYEQVGIVIPGSVLLFGLLFFVPSLKDLLAKDSVSVGQLGIFVLLSYAAGHLIAAVGNWGENLLWMPFGGMPSNWVIQQKTTLLSDQQREKLPQKLQARLGITISSIIGLERRNWFPISRQIYSDVERNGKRDRIETFNGNYGLNRGLAGSSLVLACAAFAFGNWQVGVGLLVFCGVYAYRAYRFGVHYGRELYVQFLSMSDTPGKPSRAPKDAKLQNSLSRVDDTGLNSKNER
jgi:hypothetical protein